MRKSNERFKSKFGPITKLTNRGLSLPKLIEFVCIGHN